MSRCLGSALLLTSLLFTVFGQLPKPQNVRMHSINFKHTLQWDAPIFQGGNLTYTAQYMSSCIESLSDSPSSEESSDQCQVPKDETEEKSSGSCSIGFQDTCQKTVFTKCRFMDFTYGSFCLRVRSEFQNRTSAWQSIHFTPLAQTGIGSPSDLLVKSRAGYLDVSFKCPMHEHEQICLDKIHGSWEYTVRYWKNSIPSQVSYVTAEQTFVMLSNLEPWTSYCVQVQAGSPDHGKIGELSPVVCETTSDDGHVPWWIKTVAFLVAMVLVAGVVTGGYYVCSHIYRVTKYIFFPTCSFPQHLKEYLNQPVYNAPFLPVIPNEDVDEFFNKVTVISEESQNCSEHSADPDEETAKLNQDSQEPDQS
ncbi:interleukin-10 receptor subunit beta isoform X3 [Ambystoma mexicanum]|uniref:interleukin-10 receptor subunit beta isoform X3 n=1 Tax=Ambystoma mexicanum TaxID=8296 RepID=UPI0037E784FC